MKKFARILAIIMVVALSLAMAAPALAAGIGTPADPTKPGSITIKNAVPDQTYTIYRIADLASYDPATSSYSYVANEYWYNFLSANGVTFDASRHVTGHSISSDVAAKNLAKAIIAHAELPASATHTPSATATAVVDTAADAGAAPHNGIVQFTNLPLGYYVIRSSVGVAVSLTTTDYDVKILEKNGIPTIDKDVIEDSLTDRVDVNDADMDQPIDFIISVTAVVGGIRYIVADKMSEGLDLDPSTIKVLYHEAGPADEDITGVAGTDYELYLRTDYADQPSWEAAITPLVGAANIATFADYDFFIKLNDDLLREMPAGKTVDITYQAKLNDQAVIGVVGNPNTARLIHGNDPFHISEEETTTTYSWDIKIFKFTGTRVNPTPLAGAGFTFYLHDPVANPATPAMYFEPAGTNADGVPLYNYVLNVPVDTTGLVTEIFTDATGKFIIQGLDSTNYYMSETTTPPGYNPIQGVVPITVSVSGPIVGNPYGGTSLSSTVSGTTDGWVMVLNTTSVYLPETGGIGTVIFISTGAFLVITMGILLVVKKRMGSVIYTR